MAEIPKIERLEMRATSNFLKKVDEWRRHQPDIPNRSEAIRRLVEQALAGQPRAKKSK